MHAGSRFCQGLWCMHAVHADGWRSWWLQVPYLDTVAFAHFVVLLQKRGDTARHMQSEWLPSSNQPVCMHGKLQPLACMHGFKQLVCIATGFILCHSTCERGQASHRLDSQQGSRPAAAAD